MGKKVLITGATSGIGKATAREMAARGYEVIIAARNPGKGERTRAEIVSATGNPAVACLPLDLSSLDSISKFIPRLSARYDSLDVLINNAGVMCYTHRCTEDRLEMQMAVNHLGPLALTLGLLPLLNQSPAARIVCVSTLLHKWVRFDEASFRDQSKFKGSSAYINSKIASAVCFKELSRRLEGSPVSVNLLHPGAVNTPMLDAAPLWLKWTARALFTTPEKGARTSVYLATSPQVEGANGQFFNSSKSVPYGRQLDDVKLARSVWDRSCRYCKIDPDAAFAPAPRERKTRRASKAGSPVEA